MINIQRNNTGRDRGFTLMEVLVALGIFTMGLIAIATVFPTAIAVQRESVEIADAKRIGQSAEMVLNAYARSYTSDTSKSITIPAVTNASEVATARGNRIQEDFFTFKHSPRSAVTSSLKDAAYWGSLANLIFTNAEDLDNTNRTFFNRYAGSSVRPMIFVNSVLRDDATVVANPNAALSHPCAAFMGDANLNVTAAFSEGFISPSRRTPNERVLFMPSTITYPATTAEPTTRDYIWYPFIQNVGLSNWRVIVMVARNTYDPDIEYYPIPLKLVVERPRGENYYQIMNDPQNAPLGGVNANDSTTQGELGVPDLIQIGDQILDSRGNIHTVTNAIGDQIETDTMLPLPAGMRMCFYFIARVSNLPGSIPAADRIIREKRSPTVGIEPYTLFVSDPRFN